MKFYPIEYERYCLLADAGNWFNNTVVEIKTLTYAVIHLGELRTVYDLSSEKTFREMDGDRIIDVGRRIP